MFFRKEQGRSAPQGVVAWWCESFVMFLLGIGVMHYFRFL